MIIGVIGGGDITEEIGELAEEIGRGIAENDGILICGGLGGVMEMACKGAKEANGLTVGVLPTMNPEDADASWEELKAEVPDSFYSQEDAFKPLVASNFVAKWLKKDAKWR